MNLEKGKLLTLMLLWSYSCSGGENNLPGREIEMRLTEFGISPAVVEANVGEQLVFKIVNDGVLDHNFTVISPDGEELASVDMGNGEAITLNLVLKETGEFEIHCAISGHAKAGMKAQLIVSE